MHTYALPDANCPALRHVGFFNRSACAFNGDLQCHKRNPAAAQPSGMTKEGLGCPSSPEMMTMGAANILEICLKCRKGEGLSCSAGLPPVASLLSGIMLHFSHFLQHFRSTPICKQPRHSALYFHVTIIQIRPTGYFLLIFEMIISVRRWRTSEQPLAAFLTFWHFIPISPSWILIGIVGYDVEEVEGHYGVKKTHLDNFFIFLIILWKFDEWKKTCFRVAVGEFFFFRLGWLWLEFVS